MAFIVRACALRRLSAFIPFFCLTLGSMSAVYGATSVGTLPGSFAVNDSGAAVYSIPITVPPGTNGMTPQLSLVYNSQSGSGMAGYGWTVSGFSVIARCPSAIYDDGETSAVQLAASDDYCLDGVRLRKISGTYGGDATYGTEVESFSRITSYTGSGADNGPDHFTVDTKDGRTYEYGNTADSRVLATGTTVARVWALDKVTDANGNDMTFTYQQDVANGDYWPVSVQYTGNSVAGTTRNHEILFDWATPASGTVPTGYVHGTLVSQTQLLHDIEVRYNGTATFTYTLSYDVDAATSRELLSSIQECNNSGGCYPATTINWQEGTVGWDLEVQTTATVGAAQAPYAHLMDVDGDGVQDLVYPGDTTWQVMFGIAGGGFGAPIDTGVSTAGYTTARVIDYNGDGRADLLYIKPSGSYWRVMVASGSRVSGNIFDDNPTTLTNTVPSDDMDIDDYDGHGLSDVMYSDGSQVYRCPNTVGQFGGCVVVDQSQMSTNKWLQAAGVTSYSQFTDMTSSFDGSGRTGRVELYGVTTSTTCTADSPPGCVPTSTTNYTWYAMTPSDTGYVSAGSISGGVTLAGQATPFPADFNGDGISDLVSAFATQYGYTVYSLYVGTGTSLNEFEAVNADSTTDPLLADYFGDGRQELIFKQYGGGWVVVGANYDASHSAFLPQSTTLSQPFPDAYVPGTVRVGDISGRGMDDLVYAVTHSNGSIHWHYRLHSGSKADLVTSISDGLGNTYTPHYASLPDNSGVYTKGGAAQYPVVDSQPAMYVVSSYTATDPEADSGSYSISYSYGGLQQDMEGLFLGFNQIITTDNRSHNTDTRTFYQEFPWIGETKKDLLQKSSGVSIREVDNTGNSKKTYGTGSNSRYLPFFTSSKTTDFDKIGVNAGQQTRSVETTLLASNFDAYGNIKDVTTTVTDYANGSNTYTTEVATLYDQSTSPYCVSLPNQITVTRTVPASRFGASYPATAARITTFVNDLTHCRPNTSTIASGQSNDGSNPLTQSFTYDDFGNVNTVTPSGTGIAYHKTTAIYTGDDGEFPTTVTRKVSGTLSLKSGVTWRYDFGSVDTVTDPNSLQTAWAYDGFGRPKSVTHADGTVASWSYYFCSSALYPCPSTGAYQIVSKQTSSSGTAITTGYTTYDSKGREVEQGRKLLGGAMSKVQTEYDSYGHVTSVSHPFTGNAPAFFTTYKYSLAMNRVTSESQPLNESDTCAPCGNTTSYTYDGLSVTATQTVTNSASSSSTQATTRATDALGQVITMTDANGKDTNYDYDAFGDLTGVQDAAQHVTSISYDGLGHKLGMTDPDMGQWSYQYDALGELTCQIDANGQSIIQTYDGLGRLTTRLEPAVGAGCSATTGKMSTWNYDTQPNGLGLPASVADDSAFTKTYSYDTYSRPTALDTVIGGTDYQVSTTYDSFSRIATVTYPAAATPTSAVPVASATATPGSVVGGGTVTLDGSASTDPNGMPLQYFWTQTSGSPVTILDSTSKVASVVLSQGGTYTFQLTVADANGASAPASVSATVTTPSSPTGLSLSPNPSTDGSYTLSWTAPDGVITGYQVYESANSGSFTQVASPGGTSTTFNGKDNGKYKYYVVACNSAGCGPASSKVTETVTLPPGKPTGLSVSPNPSGDGSYAVSWNAPTGVVTSYKLYQKKNSGSYTLVDSAATSPYPFSGKGDGDYTYYVVACNQTACGTASATVTETVLNIPQAPTLSVNYTTISSGGSITLTWVNNGGSVASYTLQRDRDMDGWTGLYTGTARTYSQTLTVVATYKYRVEACNASGCSPWSNVITVTVQSTSGGGGCSTCAPIQQSQPATAAPAPASDTSPTPAPSATSSSSGAVSALDTPAHGELAMVAYSFPATAEAVSTISNRGGTASFGNLSTPEQQLTRARERFVPSVPASRVTGAQIAAAPVPTPGMTPSRADLPVSADEMGTVSPGRNWHYLTSGTSSPTPYRFTVQYSYDAASGALTAAANADTGFVYWQAATGNGSAPVDAFGHLLAYTDGNNVSSVFSYDQATGAITGLSSGIEQTSTVQNLLYAWDGFGNLSQRCDSNRKLAEGFSYDGLDRLHQANASTNATTNTDPGAYPCTPGTPATSLTVTYDDLGNINTRSDVGTYSYDPNHVHAVQSVTGLPGTYQYDADGNLIARNGQAITWTPDNLPEQITSASGQSTFSYGPDRQRYEQVATDASGTTTTVYIGNLFEVVANAAGTEYRHNILVGGETIATHAITAGGTVQTRYLHYDHLGSVDAVTDEDGNVVQTMSFDAFGNRRDPSTWSGTVSNTGLTGITDRGFTDQEQLDNLNLVHMNGRVYDPVIGRFISADPTVPNPLYSQSFNRYSYVYNNPLAMVDPSGFDPNINPGRVICLGDLNSPTGCASGKSNANGGTGTGNKGSGTGGNCNGQNCSSGSGTGSCYANHTCDASGNPCNVINNCAGGPSQSCSATKGNDCVSAGGLEINGGMGDSPSIPGGNCGGMCTGGITQGPENPDRNDGIVSPSAGNQIMAPNANDKIHPTDRPGFAVWNDVANLLMNHGRGHLTLAIGSNGIGSTVDVTVSKDGIFIRPGFGFVEGDSAVLAGELHGSPFAQLTAQEITGFNWSVDFFGAVGGEVPSPAYIFGVMGPITTFPQAISQNDSYLGGGFGVGDAATWTWGYTFTLIRFGGTGDGN